MPSHIHTNTYTHTDTHKDTKEGAFFHSDAGIYPSSYLSLSFSISLSLSSYLTLLLCPFLQPPPQLCPLPCLVIRAGQLEESDGQSVLGIPQQDESQLGGWSDFRAELMDGWMNDGGRGRRDRRCCVTMAAGEKGSEKERERENGF